MSETLFWIILTILLFSGAMFLYQRHPRVWTLPILTVTAVLIVILVYSGVSHAEYMQGGQYLSKMLGPAITAFAIPLYRVRHHVRRFLPEIGLGVLLGTCIAMSSDLLLGLLLHLERTTNLALLPKSVTLPVALAISQKAGGTTTLTAAFVLLTGLTGSVVGPKLMTGLKIRHFVSRGVGLASIAHVMGATKSMSLDQREGAVGLLTMVLTAVCASIIAPFLITWLYG